MLQAEPTRARHRIQLDAEYSNYACRHRPQPFLKRFGNWLLPYRTDSEPYTPWWPRERVLGMPRPLYTIATTGWGTIIAS